MSKTNQWNDDEDDIEGYDPYRARPLVSPRVLSLTFPVAGNKWTPTATPPSLVKSNVPERRVNPKPTFDERRYQGLNPSKSLDNLSSKSKPPFSPTYSSTHHLHSPKATERVEEHLTRAEDVGFIPLSKETVSIGQGAVVTTPRPAPTPPATPAAPSTPPVRRGFVLEMAKKYEQEHPEGSGKGPTFVRPARRKSEWNYQKQSAAAVAPAVPAPRTLPPRESTSAKVSVQEAVYAIEHPSTTGQSHSTAVDEATDDPYKRERRVYLMDY
ncbi:hypothetical protein ANCCAN_19281 [Ancylostoma caninum]|uniref:Uncharacterized protein n=1 Tax=Ancylostoma caninum TaxID=29170 RepID=A0A368FRM4_ANCCA|nr:hypothetical protein ANCCAN_19281 [Ancylostoma caninum]